MFFDTVRARVKEMQAQAAVSERVWLSRGVPWNPTAFKECRLSSLHLATLFLSRSVVTYHQHGG